MALSVRGIRRAAPLHVSGSDDGLLPSASALVERVQKLLGESLAPLDVELLALAELDREVVREVLPEAAGGIRSGIGGDLEAQRAGAGRLDVRHDARALHGHPVGRKDEPIGLRLGIEPDAFDDRRLRTTLLERKATGVEVICPCGTSGGQKD